MKAYGYFGLALFVAFGTGGRLAAGPQTRPAGEVIKEGPTESKVVPAPNELLEKVQVELRKMNSLEADFEELVRSPDRKSTMRFFGHVAAKEPNRVMWYVKRPLPTAVRVVGEDLRMWDQGTGKVSVISLAGNPTYMDMARQTREWAGGNFKVLAQSYDIFVEEDKPLTLRFVPKSATANVVSSVALTLADDFRSIRRIRTVKVTGEEYVITLTNSRVNEAIRPEVWAIPPK